MLVDVNLLYTNSVQYNGEMNPITATALKIVKTCEEQFEEHAEQFDALEKNLEQQSLSHRNYADTVDPTDSWFTMTTTTENRAEYSFSATLQGKFNLKKKKQQRNENFQIFIELLDQDENIEGDSPGTAGMSLETFIGRNVVEMGQVIQAMETDVNPQDQEDSQMNNEAITTEDILGKNQRKLFLFQLFISF